MYENPEHYSDEEEKRHDMLKRAIQYMEKKKADNEEIEMEAKDIVNAAKKFEHFVKKGELKF